MRDVRQIARPQQSVVDPHDQHILVVRTVENADIAAARHLCVVAPEKFVIQFLLAGMLERRHLAALGIDAAHHMLDGAVLARRIPRLEDQQQ